MSLTQLPPPPAPPFCKRYSACPFSAKRYVAGLFFLFLYPFVHLSDDKVEQSSLCIRKQFAGQGLNPGLPDRGFEAFSAQTYRPPPLPNYITFILSYSISVRLLQTFISMRAKETSGIISQFKRECGEAMERRRMLA